VWTDLLVLRLGRPYLNLYQLKIEMIALLLSFSLRWCANLAARDAALGWIGRCFKAWIITWGADFYFSCTAMFDLVRGYYITVHLLIGNLHFNEWHVKEFELGYTCRTLHCTHAAWQWGLYEQVLHVWTELYLGNKIICFLEFVRNALSIFH
jgi:hypothetical protein